MAIKSLVTRCEFDFAGNSHNCQANEKHRILKGQSRLKVRKGRSWDHYCLDCAKKIIENDYEKIRVLHEQQQQLVSGPAEKVVE